MYMGEVVGTDGGRWELNLKGAGRTPLSKVFEDGVRTDGRKTLSGMVRELLVSEATASLGIPSSRTACIVLSDTVKPSTDNTQSPAPCALGLRLSPSMLRVGS